MNKTTLNYVNMFNHGIREVKSQLAENGNPAPEFKVDYITAFAVEIPVAKDDEPAVNSGVGQLGQESREKSREKSMEKSREKIICLIRENPTITQKDLVEALHLSVKTIEKHIKNLKAEGLLRRVGPDKGGHWEIIDSR